MESSAAMIPLKKSLIPVWIGGFCLRSFCLLLRPDGTLPASDGSAACRQQGFPYPADGAGPTFGSDDFFMGTRNGTQV
jgi:hypothetical protein